MASAAEALTVLRNNAAAGKPYITKPVKGESLAAVLESIFSQTALVPPLVSFAPAPYQPRSPWTCLHDGMGNGPNEMSEIKAGLDRITSSSIRVFSALQW